MKKNELSFLNVIFCLIVIFIHICSEPVTSLTYGTYTHAVFFTLWKLSAFVVQGFIMLSGIKLFLSKKEDRYSKYMLLKISKIFLPYVFAVVAYYLYFLSQKYYNFSIVDLGKYILRGDIAAQFYFVIIIMQFYILKPAWEGCIKKLPASYGVTVSAVLSVFGITLLGKIFGSYNDRIFTTYLIYWCVGCYIGGNYNEFVSVLKRHGTKIICIYFPVAIAEVVCAYYKNLPYYMSEILHIVYCLSAIFAVYTIALKLGEKVMEKRLMQMINGSSYYIYLWHVLVIFISNCVMDNVGIVSVGVRFMLRAVATYALSIFLCGMYRIIRKKSKG